MTRAPVNLPVCIFSFFLKIRFAHDRRPAARWPYGKRVQSPRCRATVSEDKATGHWECLKTTTWEGRLQHPDAPLTLIRAKAHILTREPGDRREPSPPTLSRDKGDVHAFFPYIRQYLFPAIRFSVHVCGGDQNQSYRSSRGGRAGRAGAIVGTRQSDFVSTEHFRRGASDFSWGGIQVQILSCASLVAGFRSRS